MICQNCCSGREQDCLGKTKHKTWCDWLGYPHDTVILQSQFCKHLRASDTYCPTCGKVFDGPPDSIEPTHAEPTYDSSPVIDKETERDNADNFRTNPDDKVEGVTFSYTKNSPS